MADISILAQRLRELRRKADMTQSEVAEKVNISQSSYAYYETGKKQPSIETLKALADLYMTSVDYIIGRY